MASLEFPKISIKCYAYESQIAINFYIWYCSRAFHMQPADYDMIISKLQDHVLIA